MITYGRCGVCGSMVPKGYEVVHDGHLYHQHCSQYIHNRIVAVDFDGTVVRHEYPLVGLDVPGAVDVLRQLQDRHHLILYTMRHGRELADAEEWFGDRGINLWAVNGNPGQSAWTDSPKVHAHIYIDDAALGCPLLHPPDGRPYVDWNRVWEMLQDTGYLPRRRL